MVLKQASFSQTIFSYKGANPLIRFYDFSQPDFSQLRRFLIKFQPCKSWQSPVRITGRVRYILGSYPGEKNRKIVQKIGVVAKSRVAKSRVAKSRVAKSRSTFQRYIKFDLERNFSDSFRTPRSFFNFLTHVKPFILNNVDYI